MLVLSHHSLYCALTYKNILYTIHIYHNFFLSVFCTYCTRKRYSSLYGYGHLCHTVMRSHYFHTTTHTEVSSLRRVVMVGSDSGAEYSHLPSGRKGGRSPQSQIQCGCRLAGPDSGPEGIGSEEKALSWLN